MSDSSGRWSAFIRSFIDAFLKASRKSSGSAGGVSAKPKPPATQSTATRPAPSQRTGNGRTSAEYGEASPGQYGPGATRELSHAEIQALRPSYAPEADGDPDPGEIVWTWVPYVENDGRGKDRPVLIIARIDAETTAGCYLSTKEHRGFVSVGSGPWDSKGRESFLSPERILLVSHDGMRREGNVLPRERFDPAVAAVLRAHGVTGSH
ncbi:type II toxin-antitoxin system PemK/MazF family toxin [Leucobacter luti]|uniref:PemK-like, MazF-like toxin of type II toxin-antitoxin system n=1 Tax=Leucobacter luti TaxID=340320 RepID=A0A4Q7TIQ9_9MICO|nr:type II toxin-antitoxin system PemK/MazF family toxin [Leucobacter luti]MBL3700364.1 hypothetical protein [Leucobacter luti]RZT60534.1 hypothetical protein EV139_2979 [Leucobacter luti]